MLQLYYMWVYVEQQLPILPLLAVLCSTWGNVHPTQALAYLIPSCSIATVFAAWSRYCPSPGWTPTVCFSTGLGGWADDCFHPKFPMCFFFNSVCTSRSSACLMFFVDGSYHHLAIVFPDILLVKNRRNFARKSWSKAVVGCFIQLFWWLNVVGKQNTT